MRCDRLTYGKRRWAALLLAGWLVGVLASGPVRAQPSNADALREAVHAALAERFSADMHRIEVRIKRAGGTADEVVQPRVTFRSLDRLPRGAAQARVHRRREGRWQPAGWVLLYVAHFDSVLVADRTVRSGEEIERSDVQVRWTETTRFRGESLSTSTFDTASLLFATRYLRKGRLLRANDVRPPYAADTGQSVTVHYQRGGLHMEVQGKAREPGFVGDVIRIYVPDTDAAYRARLVEPGLAEWIETL